MFVDLMDDIYTTFAERFLRVQLQFAAPAPAAAPPPRQAPAAPKKRFNALGVMEEAPAERPDGTGSDETLDIGPGEPPSETAVRRDPVVVGAGRPRTLTPARAGRHRLVERRAERPLSVRLRKEVQEVPRGDGIDDGAALSRPAALAVPCGAVE